MGEVSMFLIQSVVYILYEETLVETCTSTYGSVSLCHA